MIFFWRCSFRWETVSAVESSAGLSLLPDAMKAVGKPLCQVCLSAEIGDPPK